MTTSAELSERRLIALQLRRAGYDMVEIANRMGCPLRTAYEYVKGGQEEFSSEFKESDESIKELELSRLDDVMPEVMKAAKAGDLKAIDTMLKIQERRAKYLGLDAPAKQNVNVESDNGVKLVLGVECDDRL